MQQVVLVFEGKRNQGMPSANARNFENERTY